MRWIVAAALLGPMGLFWLRMAMPWHAVERGRAVDLLEDEHAGRLTLDVRRSA